MRSSKSLGSKAHSVTAHVCLWILFAMQAHTPNEKIGSRQNKYARLARRLLYLSLSWGASFTNISRVRLRKHTTSWSVASWLGALVT
jgi:hypothetical protein